MRVVFMGTPDFAVPSLQKLIEAGYEIVAVITQPDKPKGRGKTMQYTPVKAAALEAGIPVLQPVRVREPEFIEKLRGLQPDLIAVVAFGQILPKEILDMPRYGCVNVHGSLLPLYRGAAPIQWAVIDGQKESGITTQRMDIGCDTGDIIKKAVIPLAPDETGGSLFDKLSIIGGDVLRETLAAIEAGTAVYEPQDHERATHASKLTKQTGCIDWSQPAEKIECLIRGLNPWPSAYTHYMGKTLKIWAAHVENYDAEGECGQLVKVNKQEVHVKTGEGILVLDELQLEGKKRMLTDALLRGYQMEAGQILGKQ